MSENSHIPTPQSKMAKKPKGCFFYGCLTSIILLIVVTVGGYFLVSKFITGAVEKYTSTTPLPLPTIAVTQEEYSAIKQRVQEFIKAIESGAGPKELELSTHDLNALIINDPDWKALKNKVYIEGGTQELSATINYPLDEFGFSGRYFTGKGSFEITLENGILVVTAKKLWINGSEIPETIMEQWRDQNLAQNLYKDKNKLEFIKKLENITIKDGVVIVKRRD